MEVKTYEESQDVLPRIEANLYYMLGLDQGYYWGMERFLKRMDETIDYYAIHDSDENRKWWISLKSMSLKDKTREWMKEEYNSYQKKLSDRELNMSMKEVAIEKTVASLALHTNGLNDNDKRYNKLLCEMEDDPMPAVYKRKIFRKLDGFLWSFYSSEELQCTTDIAFGICKF
jgi:hypothetical protein